MSLILPSVLTIAGSDSSGGAGIQADLKTIEALGLYGSSVITTLTAQNTTKVYLTETVSQDMLCSQLDAVFSDIVPQAVKIGMVGNASLIQIITKTLARYNQIPTVLDPVMVSTSGCRLLESSAVTELTEKLFPLVTLITPNLPEAEVLLSTKSGVISTQSQMEEAVRDLSKKYRTSFLLKGGHSKQGASDVLCHQGKVIWFPNEPVPTINTHGTGCTLSSAIACGLAKGLNLEESIKIGKEYLTGALSAGLNMGKGNGPLWHGYKSCSG